MSSLDAHSPKGLEEGEVRDQSVQETWSKTPPEHQEKKMRLKKKKKEKQKEKKRNRQREKESGALDEDSKFKTEPFVPLKDKDSDLVREVVSLRMELKGAYQMMRIVQSGLNETITRERNKNIKAEIENEELVSENNELMTENEELREYLNETQLAYADTLERRVNEYYRLLDSQEEWIGRTLKFQYLFQQMEKIGLKQSEDIFDTFQDIEVPEVSIDIKDKFVPTAQTDNIDWSDEADIESDVEVDNEAFDRWVEEWDESDIIGEEDEGQTILDWLPSYYGELVTNEDFRPDDEDMSEALRFMFNED
jgi:hypothetical protein